MTEGVANLSARASMNIYFGCWLASLMYSAEARMSSGVAITKKLRAFSLPKVSYDHFRVERIAFTAAIPLFATSTYKRTNAA